MRSVMLFGLLVCGDAGLLADQAPEACIDGSDGATLEVRLTGFGSPRGRAVVALFDSEASHTARRGAVRTGVLPIHDGVARFTATQLPCGIYSVLAFHDENGNGRLDTGTFGIPKEAYGASRDARARTGPPPFDEARFAIERAHVDLRVELR